MTRFILVAVCGALTIFSLSPLQADSPDENALVGDPVSLELLPESFALVGPRASQQLIVTGFYADGTQRDLTELAAWQPVDGDVLDVTTNGFATGLRDGVADLDVRVGGLHARVPVTVKNSQQERPVGFRHEVMPVLSAAGCSDIRCHGAPSGKGGFRLSLWGGNPDLDYQQLTHAAYARRTSPHNPDSGLIMLKALARVGHVGGQRFESDSRFAELLRAWQTEGVHDKRDVPALHSLEVVPAHRILHAPVRWQQLAVRATFKDGSRSDVTRRTTFSSSDVGVAGVDRNGRVEFLRQGEVAILCRFLDQMVSVRLLHIVNPPADFRWPDPPAENFVDTHVFAKLKLLNIAPAALCRDEQFVRRVYLDLCGVLPTPAESGAFLSSTEPDKRARLVDQLLQRPEYADYWTKKWMDVLRTSRDSIQWVGSKAYHGWLRDQIDADESFADVAQELLTAMGESYKDPAANFFCVAPTPKKVTDPHYLQKDLAEATAQLFLGVRLQCARCHDHPFERWTQDDYLGLAAFFTQVKRGRLGKPGRRGRPDRRQMEISLDLLSGELTHESTGATVAPQYPGESRLDVDPHADRRQLLAAWLAHEKNPFFAKAVVNRVWFHLHGRGIVEPVDDFRDSNPSANDALLESLAARFIANGYRLKPLIRTIVNSRTYQLSAVANSTGGDGGRYFAHMVARPLPAEVLLDAICEVTGVAEEFEIMKDYIEGIPTESLKIPAGMRSVQLPVNDIVTLINSDGKYVRYESHPFLRAFGQPNRTQTCECDREQKFSQKQALELIVGPLLTEKLAQQDNRLGQYITKGRADREILNELYLLALSRVPDEDAADHFLQHVASSTDRRQGWEDVLWTLLNSQEFIYQH